MIQTYLSIFLPIATLSLIVCIFLGVWLNNGESFFYAYLLTVPSCLLLASFKHWIINKLFKAKVDKAINLVGKQKRFRFHNISSFAILYAFFNMAGLLPLVIGILLNRFAFKAEVFNEVTLFILTALLLIAQLGTQIYDNIKTKKSLKH